jgi:3-oxoacyl-[acyl-carrier-protein] synthase-3
MSDGRTRGEEHRGSVIVGTGACVPERVLTNADLERMVDTNDQWIRDRTGIRERRIADPAQAVSDLSFAAAKKALEMAHVDPADLDLILIATLTPDRWLPSASCTLQEMLGARHAAAFDLNAACSGFIYGLGVGDSMIRSGAETLSRIVDYQDRSTCVLFGDGAGAAVLRPSPAGRGVLAVELRSDGTQGNLLEIPAGGSRLPASHQTVDERGHFIKMRGNELFKFAVRSMESVSRATMEAAGVSPEEVSLLIPHQANYRIVKATADRLGVPEERIVLNIERLGNTSAASVPIGLDEAVRGGRLKEGEKFAMVAFGGGVTWGAAVCEWNPKVAEPLHGRAAAAGATAGPGERA